MTPAFINLWVGTEVDDFVIATGATVAATGLIITFAVQVVRKVVRPTVRFFRRASKAWDYIETELSNNGGATVKDKADAAAAEAAETRRLLEDVARDVARIKVRLRLDDPDGPDDPVDPVPGRI